MTGRPRTPAPGPQTTSGPVLGLSQGKLITFDGPGGAGKTTLTELIATQLAGQSIPYLRTTQPSRSAIGELARTGTHRFRGLSLACLVAADRYLHIEEVIRPAVAAGRIVLCDRYVPSSHALQVLDGVDQGFVEELNAYTDRPDLAVILTCDPDELTRRLAARGSHGRFEDDPDFPARELTRYKEVIALLRSKGIRTLHLDSTRVDVDYLANAVVTAIHALASNPTATTHTTAGKHVREVRGNDRRSRDP